MSRPTPTCCPRCNQPIFVAVDEKGRELKIDAAPNRTGSRILAMRGGQIVARIAPIGAKLAPGEQLRQAHACAALAHTLRLTKDLGPATRILPFGAAVPVEPEDEGFVVDEDGI